MTSCSIYQQNNNVWLSIQRLFSEYLSSEWRSLCKSYTRDTILPSLDSLLLSLCVCIIRLLSSLFSFFIFYLLIFPSLDLFTKPKHYPCLAKGIITVAQLDTEYEFISSWAHGSLSALLSSQQTWCCTLYRKLVHKCALKALYLFNALFASSREQRLSKAVFLRISSAFIDGLKLELK